MTHRSTSRHHQSHVLQLQLLSVRITPTFVMRRLRRRFTIQKTLTTLESLGEQTGMRLLCTLTICTITNTHDRDQRSKNDLTLAIEQPFRVRVCRYVRHTLYVARCHTICCLRQEPSQWCWDPSLSFRSLSKGLCYERQVSIFDLDISDPP